MPPTTLNSEEPLYQCTTQDQTKGHDASSGGLHQFGRNTPERERYTT